MDVDHIMSCARNRRTLLNRRHNNVAATLAKLARQAGFTVEREPLHHLRPDTTIKPGDAHWNEHGDLLLVKHDRRLLIDVSIVRSSSTSMMHAQKSTVWQPLIAARKKVEQKHVLYDALAKANEWEMFGFVCESYGGLAPEARRLLRIIASHAPDEIGEQDFLTYAYRSISVCLQNGNAAISQDGMQFIRTADLRRDGRLAAGRRYEVAHRDQKTERAPAVATAPVDYWTAAGRAAVQERSEQRRRKRLTAALGEDRSESDSPSEEEEVEEELDPSWEPALVQGSHAA
jgi:hypothetical protein